MLLSLLRVTAFVIWFGHLTLTVRWPGSRVIFPSSEVQVWWGAQCLPREGKQHVLPIQPGLT